MRHNFFSKTPFSKLLMFMRQSEKIRKMLLATRWSLVGARVTTFVYIYTYATQLFFKNPFSKLLMFMRRSEKIWKIRFYLIFCHLWKPPLTATRPSSIAFSCHLKTRKRVAYLGAVTVELPFSCSAVAVQLPGICQAVTIQSLGSRWAVKN